MKFADFLPARWRRDVPVIPVVRLSGAILAGGSPFRPALNLANVAGPLERAFSFRRAPAVALVVNSPGGSPVQSRLIYRRIRELAAKHGKKVLVFVEDVAASGGYMIALAGDEIVADETSIVGSIGVIAAGFGLDKAIARLGVERRVYTAGENKMILDAFQPEKARDVEHVKALQAEMHAIFIAMVRERRGAKLAEAADLFTGLFWTGAKAKELGLVDANGLLGPTIAERYGDKAQLRLIGPRRGLFGRAQPGIGAGLAAWPDASALAGELPRAAIEALEERLLWSRFGL